MGFAARGGRLFEVDGADGFFEEGDACGDAWRGVVFGGGGDGFVCGEELGEPAADHGVVAGVGAEVGDGFEAGREFRVFEGVVDGEDFEAEVEGKSANAGNVRGES